VAAELAVCVAAELKARGNDVALIDNDPQGSACRWAEPGNLDFPVTELVLGEQSVGTWAEEVQRIMASYVVIDTAPSDGSLGAATATSDLVLVPRTPSGLDLDATTRTLEIVDAVRVRPNGVPRLFLAPNRVDRRTLEGR
jgi:chromosome partitioning protein